MYTNHLVCFMQYRPEKVHLCCVCIRPNDSRMLVALGECYEKLSQQVEAKKVNSYDYSALE